MKIIVERSAILHALQKVIGAIEKKQTLSILTNVFIEKSNNSLYLTCTDLEVQITAQCPCLEVETFSPILLPAKKLTDIVRNFENDKNIKIETLDSKIKISSGSSEYTLNTTQYQEFPRIIESDNEGTFEISSINFQTSLEKVLFSVADQDIRYYLNGLLIDISLKEKSILFVGTDGHRLSLTRTTAESVKFFESLDKKRLLLPKKAANELIRLLEKNLRKEDIINIKLHQNHISFSFEEFSFVSKLIEGDFPNYEKLLIKDNISFLSFSKKDLLKVLNKALVISDEKNKSMSWFITENSLKIEVSSENQDFSDNLAIHADKAEKIAFNIRYIKEFLEMAEEETIVMQFNDNNTSSLFSEKKGNYQYLVMPVRI